MKNQHHIIYVPGILDDIYRLQSLLVAGWRLYGVRGHCHPIPWSGSESWNTKFERLLQLIDTYKDRGHTVSLVGASAGASAAMNAFLERRKLISGVVLVCAKINFPETVSEKTYGRNPAFRGSLKQLQTGLTKLSGTDKTKILSLYSSADKTVPYAASHIPGVEERALPPLNHGKAIVYALSLGAAEPLGFLQRPGARPL